MSTYDLLVRGGLVVSSREIRQADVAVRDGTIAAVGQLDASSARQTIDATDRYVLPGVIDVHSHPVYADDMAQTCRAAAAGGVTTIVPYIGAFPSWGFPKTTPLQAVDAFAERWSGEVACDFGVHAAIDAQDDLAADIDELVALGVSSFKFFMAYRQRGMMVDDDALVRNFDLVGARGAIAVVHAENGAAISYLEDRYWDDDEVANDRFLRCHTDLVEAESVLRAIALADAVGCAIYIPHLAVAEGLEAIAIARRAASVPVWVETCPHYLLLTNDEVLRRGALSKIAPPLRHVHDNEALWGGIARGAIQVVGTDHCGRTVEAKTSAKNLLQAPYGAESIEHLLPLMYSEGVGRGRIGMRELVRVLAENPADIFGLSPLKGRIVPGADADLVVLDPTRRRTCSAKSHVGNSDYCLYEGRETVGGPELTILRGQVTYDGSEATDRGGRFVARRLPGPEPAALAAAGEDGRG